MWHLGTWYSRGLGLMVELHDLKGSSLCDSVILISWKYHRKALACYNTSICIFPLRISKHVTEINTMLRVSQIPWKLQNKPGPQKLPYQIWALSHSIQHPASNGQEQNVKYSVAMNLTLPKTAENTWKTVTLKPADSSSGKDNYIHRGN